jgi:hypothetical protein
MRVPSRAPVLLAVAMLATAVGGCGGADDTSGGGTDSGRTTASGPPLRGLEARRTNAPAVLAAVEKVVGEDDVLDLTFEKDRFTVLTSWVTPEQHENPADDLEAKGKVPRGEETAAVCRAIRDTDPGAAAAITGDDGTALIARCPQNARNLRR